MNAAARTEQVTTATGESYTITWAVTEYASRAAAHKALRDAGFTFNRPSRRGGLIFKGTGYWSKGAKLAVVNGAEVSVR